MLPLVHSMVVYFSYYICSMSLLRLNLQAEIAMIEQNIYPILRIVPYFVPYIPWYSMAKIYPIGYNRKIFGYNILPKTETNYPPKTQEDKYFLEKLRNISSRCLIEYTK